MSDNSWLGSVKGIVETLEQKSGLNSILFIIAVISLPSLVLYSVKGQAAFLWFAGAPIAFAAIVYILAFIFDRDFLRSERHVIEKRQLDILGEKGRLANDDEIYDVPATTDPAPDIPMIKGKNK